MSRLTILCLIITVIFPCRERADERYDLSADIVLTGSSADLLEALQNNPASRSDPFDLGSILIRGNSVNTEVTNSGGCRRHIFEIIWDGILTRTDPPTSGIIITHDSCGDMCEARITEILSFSMVNLTDYISFNTVSIKIQNGCYPFISIVTGG